MVEKWPSESRKVGELGERWDFLGGSWEEWGLSRLASWVCGLSWHLCFSRSVEYLQTWMMRWAIYHLKKQIFFHFSLKFQQRQMEVHGDLAKTKTHLVDSLDLLIYLLLLFVTILTLWVFKRKRVMFLHESGLSVLIGLVVGAILRFTGRPNSALKVFLSPVETDAIETWEKGNNLTLL